MRFHVRYKRALMAVLLSVSAAATSLTAWTAPAAAASDVGGTITRAEVIERAKYWLNRGDTWYSQDQDDAKPDGDGHSYRPDCSGFVSMAWHMSKVNGADRNTAAFHAESDLWFRLSVDSLLPGDAILKDGHMELFDRWVNPNDHTDGLWTYGEHDFGRKTEHNQMSWSYLKANNYVGLRYRKIVNSEPNRPGADFDGDGRSDLALYRPDASKGSTWWVRSVGGDDIYGAHQWGGAADIPVTGDFDGDGTADMALYRQDCTSGSTWWVKSGATGAQLAGALKFGGCKDIPATGDFNGDGADDLGLYRQDCSEGSTWHLYNLKADKSIASGVKFGGCKDIPATGDFDGDGADDLGLYRQDCSAGSTWWAKSPKTGEQLVGGLKFGGCKDIPTAGDYSGDGADDLGLYRQDCTNGSTWQLYNAKADKAIVSGLKYGGCNDIPVGRSATNA